MSINLHELDQKLAGELQKRKIANEMEQIKIKKAIESSEEIKHLRTMIQQGYLNKERAAQVTEKQTRNLIELKEEALIDRAMLQKREMELARQRQEERRKINERLDQKFTLQNQMLEKKDKCEEAREQFYKEKGQVDDIVEQIINEDKKKMEVEANKKKEAFNTMQFALADKAERVQAGKDREKRENAEYKKYLDG